MSFMWAIETEWVEDYLQRKRSGIQALERVVERLAVRHGFTSQKPQTAKKSTEELEQTRAEFTLDYWKTHAVYGPESMYNVDETAINFDMPPARMWAGRGRRDAARIANTSKHTGRMTAVLTIRTDGKKLPIMFVLRDKPGGRIDTSEFEEYPEGHFYTVQENAWMDTVTWRFYVEKLLKYEVDGPLSSFLTTLSVMCRKRGSGSLPKLLILLWSLYPQTARLLASRWMSV